MTFGFDIMLNHNLSKKFKLIGIGKFNYFINNSTTLAFTDYMMICIHYITCITSDKDVAQATLLIHKTCITCEKITSTNIFRFTSLNLGKPI